MTFYATTIICQSRTDSVTFDHSLTENKIDLTEKLN